MEFSPRPGRQLVLNMTPLIDVVFLMLVFFLLTISFVRYRVVELTFVDTRRVAESQSDRLLVIRLNDAGDLTLDGELTNINALEGAVARRLARDPRLSAVVLPSEFVPLQLTVDVLERVREAGMRNVRLGAEVGDGF